jgi:sigma-B regulation protein RsbU (phosphoserine phosphatase)
MSEKILIINDNEDIREVIEFFLQSKEYETLTAESGMRGIELAATFKPDLILLDIMMPEMDGYMTCEKLKSNSDTKNIPVIFLSTLTDSKDKVRGLEIGGVDFINTHGDQAELLARVQTHLNIKTLTQKLMASNQELTENLNAAAIIQRSFLLPPELKIAGIQHASMWVPANLLGGDIYNAIPCGPDKVIFYMLDVSGHDVPSALVTVSVSQFLFLQNQVMGTALAPKEMLQLLDKEYPIERFNRFFTIFYLVFDTTTGEVTYSCAGHPPAILLRNGHKPVMLEKGGTIIGLSKGSFDQGSERLQENDKMILYTDGVLEQKNRKGETYGLDKLHALLDKIKENPIETIVNMIKKDVEQHADGSPTFDDLSIMGFEYKK